MAQGPDAERTQDEQVDGDEMQRLRARERADAAEIADLRAWRDEAEGRRAAQDALIRRLREEASAHDGALLAARDQLAAAEDELGDLRAIRDALTPAELPDRPGLALAASFEPAAPHVGGDFYLAAAGPGDTTVLVVGDVVGKGIEAARRAAFVRTAFLTAAPFSDDPCRLLEWTNTALTERVGYGQRFTTAVCVTFDPSRHRARWAVAGHPSPLRLGSGEELEPRRRGTVLGIGEHVGCASAEATWGRGEGMLLYTDGLTEARARGRLFGTEGVQGVLREFAERPAAVVLAELREASTGFADGVLQDDLCLLAVTATGA